MCSSDLGWFDHAVDAKTSLQEYLQRDGDVKIEYHLLDETGTENDPEFHVNVMVDGKVVADGHGSSKKHAEMQAAQNALNKLRKHSN